MWTLDYPRGRIGLGDPTLRRVSVTGEVLFTSEPLDARNFWPLVGVPGGLAVTTPEGIAIWDAETATLKVVDDTGQAFGAASNGRQLAWCGDPCDEIHVSDLEVTGPATPQFMTGGRAPVFSHDGKHLALLARGPNGSILVVQESGSSNRVTVASSLGDAAAIQWGPDGQLFYPTWSYAQSSITLGRYKLDTDIWEIEQIAVGGALGFIVLDRDQAETFLSDELVDPSECKAPGGYPSGRSELCGFGF